MKAPSTPLLRRLPITGLLPLLLSCGGSDATGPGSDNSTQTPTVSAVAMLTTLAEQVVGTPVTVEVRVDGSDGSPMANQTVTFAANAGSVSPSSMPTSSSGTAATVWTLGTAAGSQTLTATASGRSASLTVTTRAGNAAAFEKVSGDGQSGSSGEALSQPIVVKVTDSFGNPKQGESLSAAVTAGNGSLNTTSTTSGSDGQASFTWTLGDVGNNTMTVTHSLGTLSFSASASVGPPTNLTKVAGDNQTATAGTAVATAPRVKVTDAQGNPVSNVSVAFAVASGGGSVTPSSVATGTDGMAAVSSWTLGSTPGENTLSATVEGLSSVTFTATGADASASSYNIDLRFVGTMSASIQAAFQNAKARWEGIVTGDLAPSSLSVDAGTCSDNQPALNEVVDDLVIFAEVGPIDGVGNTLGQAGPCYVRTADNTALLGTMTFDEADLANMEQSGTLQDVIIHEMGHVLGIGTLWDYNGLLVGKGTTDPYYTGSQGVLAYQVLGGTDPNGVPVENTGGEGTRDGHWRETTFQTELMTGYIAAPGNPLSILTVLSLEDHGYTVNATAADAYSLPSPAQARIAVTPPERRERWELLLKPRFRVSPDGTRTPMR